MDNIHQFLNKLTFSKQFITDFMDEQAPCLALGILEERKERVGFIMMRPEEELPPDVTHQGFQFGNSVIGVNETNCAVQLSFRFYGYGVYHSLVNPNNEIIKEVLSFMAQSDDYYFIVINPSNKAVTYRSEAGQGETLGISDNMDIILNATTTDTEYDRIVSAFSANPEPAGVMVNWVCRDNIGYLDLTDHTIEVSPA